MGFLTLAARFPVQIVLPVILRKILAVVFYDRLKFTLISLLFDELEVFSGAAGATVGLEGYGSVRGQVGDSVDVVGVLRKPADVIFLVVLDLVWAVCVTHEVEVLEILHPDLPP